MTKQQFLKEIEHIAESGSNEIRLGNLYDQLVARLIAPEPEPVPQLLPSEKPLTINEWKDLLSKAADHFVTNHKDSEVRRMYGHHYRSFVDGAIWEHERVKPLPLAQSDQEEIVDSLLFLLRSVPEDSLKHTILQRFTITRKPQ